MAIFNVDVTSVVELGRDPDGHLSVKTVSCEAHIEDVDLQIQGGSRYFIQEEATVNGGILMPILTSFAFPFVNSWFIQRILDHFKGRTIGEMQDNVSFSLFVRVTKSGGLV